jgi:hypothetical protein
MSIGIKQGTTAFVYNVKNEGKYISCQLVTSKKDKYLNTWISERWVGRLVGDAFTLARDLDVTDKDRIEIIDGIVDNIYDQLKKTSHLSVTIFKFKMFSEKKETQYDLKQDETLVDAEQESNEDLPF